VEFLLVGPERDQRSAAASGANGLGFLLLCLMMQI